MKEWLEAKIREVEKRTYEEYGEAYHVLCGELIAYRRVLDHLKKSEKRQKTLWPEHS